jgi:type II secretory pathway pseudopilin PulG
MARQHGFTYLGLLFAIAFIGLLMASAGQVWHTTAQREREEDLLFVGEQFSQAIAAYRLATPGQPKQYPRSLEDLVEDKRWPVPRHHLRKIFVDPMTGRKQWGLIRGGDQITGVYSLGEGRPIKQGNFPPGADSFAGAKTYQEWRFVATPDNGGAAGQAVPAE